MRLSDVASRGENNFKLIRVLAACAVLVSHCFALSTGRGESEPLRQQLHMTPGSIAVDIFFITSGFLITGSLLTRQSVLEFVWARALRIYPALWTMLVLVVFGLGVWMTTVPLAEYFGSPLTRTFMLKNGSLFNGVAYVLPGVFRDVPYKEAVNGSLWTMFHEIRLYTLLCIAWLAARWLPDGGVPLFHRLLIAAAVVAAAGHLIVHFVWSTEAKPFWQLFFMFSSGAAIYVLKERIVLKWQGFVLAFGAMLISSLNAGAFVVVYSATLAYVLLYLAYVPAGAIRQYNRLGDYSYGIYIYAFPVQQTIVALNPGIGFGRLIIWSTLVTLVLAVVSWSLLEKRMPQLKTYCVMRTRQWLRLQT